MGTAMTQCDSFTVSNTEPSDKPNPLPGCVRVVSSQGSCDKLKRRLSSVFWCAQVKLVEQGLGYLMFGGLMTATLALLPFCFRLSQHLDASNLTSLSPSEVVAMAVGPPSAKAYAFFFITAVQRVCLTGLFFFMMCVAERTYKQVISIYLLKYELLFLFPCI